MIEFFEFLNTCSPVRTVFYLVFILLITFMVFAGVADIIKRLRGSRTNNNYYLGPTDEDNKEIDEETKG